MRTRGEVVKKSVNLVVIINGSPLTTRNAAKPAARKARPKTAPEMRQQVQWAIRVSLFSSSRGLGAKAGRRNLSSSIGGASRSEAGGESPPAPDSMAYRRARLK